MVHRSVLCAGVIGVLVQGCIVVPATDDDTDPTEEVVDPPVVSCQIAGADDADGDCVDDSRDNCLALANNEQLDADDDGEGDSCDLLLVTPDAPLTVNTWDGYTAHTIATIDNNQSEAIAWTLDAVAPAEAHERIIDPSRIRFAAVEGVVAPGQRVDLTPEVLTHQLEPGRYHAAFTLTLGDSSRTIPLVVDVTEQDVDAAYCVYDVMLGEIYVDRGQGAVEGDLELRVQASAGDARITYPSAGAWLTLAEDESAYADVLVGQLRVPHGHTEAFELPLHIEDIDAGSHDAADRAAKLSLSCNAGAGARSERAAILELPSTTGGTALVEVVLHAIPRVEG